MTTRIRTVLLGPASALAALAIAVSGGLPASAGDSTKPRKGLFHRRAQTAVMRSGPGYQGFGLGYHPGYGYGGDAFGVGPDGGYPFYGGPGYPHSAPPLRRLGPIVPFAHDAGPGFPTPARPNVYGGVGPLSSDPSVVKSEAAPGVPAYPLDYGASTGMVPYPESTFAPFTAVDAKPMATSPAATSPAARPPVLPIFPGDPPPALPDRDAGSTPGRSTR